MLLPPSFAPFLAYYAGLIPSPKNACVGVQPFLGKFRTYADCLVEQILFKQQLSWVRRESALLTSFCRILQTSSNSSCHRAICIFAVLRITCENVHHFSPALPKQLSLHNPVYRASRLPCLFPARAWIIDVILWDIANVFQIWSTLAGYEELARVFEPIR